MTNKTKFNQLRHEIGLSLEELAVKMGVSYATTRAYASVTNRRVPPTEFLARMEQYLVDRAVKKLEGQGYQVVKKAA